MRSVTTMSLNDLSGAADAAEDGGLLIVLLDIGDSRMPPPGPRALVFTLVDTTLPGLGCADARTVGDILAALSETTGPVVIASGSCGGHVAAMHAGLLAAAGSPPEDALKAALGGQGVANPLIVDLFDDALELRGMLSEAARESAKATLVAAGFRPRLAEVMRKRERNVDEERNPPG